MKLAYTAQPNQSPAYFNQGRLINYDGVQYIWQLQRMVVARAPAKSMESTNNHQANASNEPDVMLSHMKIAHNLKSA